MEYNGYTYSDDLVHWGIKGMKWGVRRYQNKDGSLTAAGKKRRAKLVGELEKLGGGKKNLDDDAVTRKKSVSELSNKELQDYTTRMRLEKDYYDAKRNLDSITPKQISKGQKFVDTVINDVVKPWAKDSGKKYLDSAIKNALGIKDEQKINWDEMLKKQSYAKNEADKVLQDLKRQNDINQEKDRAEARNKKRSEANNDSSNKTDSMSSGKSTGDPDNKSTTESKHKPNDKTNNTSSGATGVKGQKWEKRSSEKVYEGEIIGEGTSKAKSSESTRYSKNDTIIDADWSEVTVSSVPSTVTNRGQSYVSGLLEESKGLSIR